MATWVRSSVLETLFEKGNRDVGNGIQGRFLLLLLREWRF